MRTRALVLICFGIILGSLAASPMTAQVAQRMFGTTPTGLTTGVSTPLTCTASGAGCTLDVIVRPATDIEAGTGDSLGWANSSQMKAPSDGVITMMNDAGTSFNRLQWGGTTALFPSLKRVNTILEARLADDSAASNLAASNFTITASGSGTGSYFAGAAGSGLWFLSGAGTKIISDINGNLTLRNAAATDFGLLQFGGTTNAFAALKRNGTGLTVRNADDTANTTLSAGNIYASSTAEFGVGNSFTFRGGSGDGIATIYNVANNDFGRLNFGGTTVAFPSLKRSAGALQVRSADDAGYASIEAHTIGVGAAAPGTSGAIRLNAILFASLPADTNGVFRYCSDCTIANPCAGGGTGALAKRLNGIWVCN